MATRERDVRRQTQDPFESPRRLQPVASPAVGVGQLTRPAMEPVDLRRSPAGQLAQALREFSPVFMQFAASEAGKRQERLTEEGALAAIQMIRDENRTIKEAVEEGLMPRMNDRFFRMGFQQALGKVAASHYRDALAAQNQVWMDSGEFTDTDQWNRAEVEFRNNWIEQNLDQSDDRAFWSTFNNATINNVGGIGHQFANAMGAQMAETMFDGIYENVQERVGGLLEAGPITTESARQATQDLMAGVDELIEFGGLPAAKANQVVVDAVVDRAVLEGDYGPLALITENPRLRNTRYAVQAVARARAEVDQQKAIETREESRKQKQASEVVMQDAVRLALESPQEFARNFESIAAQINDISPDFVPQLVGLRSAINQAQEGYDPATYQDIAIRVMRGQAGTGEVIRLMDQGLINTAQGMQLLGTLDARARAAAAGGGSASIPGATMANLLSLGLSNIDAQLGPDALADVWGLQSASQLSDARMRYIQQFQENAAALEQADPITRARLLQGMVDQSMLQSAPERHIQIQQERERVNNLIPTWESQVTNPATPPHLLNQAVEGLQRTGAYTAPQLRDMMGTSQNAAPAPPAAPRPGRWGAVGEAVRRQRENR